MLLWEIIICLFSANLIVSGFASPEHLADYDLKTSSQPLEITLQRRESPDALHLIRGLLVVRNASPLKENLQKRDSPDLHLILGLLGPWNALPEVADEDSSATLRPPEGSLRSRGLSERLHVIRGLLITRQQCPTGYGQCSNAPQCCPNGGQCCGTTGCCQSGQSCCGTGCCSSGYTCATVNGQTGCCPSGQNCSDSTPKCATSGYVVCAGENFCCPPGYTCLRDSAGNPQCKSPDPPKCQNSSYVVCSGDNFCCPPGYTCYRDSAGQPQCKSPTPQCQNSSYVVCSGENFCCPPGYTCLRDSAGQPQCKSSTPQCQNPSYVVCAGEDFCCPPGDPCYRDSAGQPQCRSPTPQCSDPSYVVCSGENFCCPSGYTCYRNSVGNPQCKPPNPTCITPDYVVCSEDNFCCPSGYKCYRDASNNPVCVTPTTTIQPTLGNTALPNAATALADPGVSPASGFGTSAAPIPSSSIMSIHQTKVGPIIGGVVGGLAGAAIIITALYCLLKGRHRGGQAHRPEVLDPVDMMTGEYHVDPFPPVAAAQDPSYATFGPDPQSANSAGSSNWPPTDSSQRPLSTSSDGLHSQSANSAGSSNWPSNVPVQGPSYLSFRGPDPQFANPANPAGGSNWTPTVTSQRPWSPGSDELGPQSTNSETSSSRPSNPPFRQSGVSTLPSQYQQSYNTAEPWSGKVPPPLIAQNIQEVPRPGVRHEDSGVRFDMDEEGVPGPPQLPEDPDLPPTYTPN